MRAAVVTSYGPPDVVRIADVEMPTPRPHELLLKVHATTVNRTDTGVRTGKPFPIARLFYGFARPRATVLGCEFAGEVAAVGGGVTAFQVGDGVFGFNAGFGRRGEFGAHAEYMIVPDAGALATIPSNLTYAEAAASTEGSTYALSLIRPAGISSGQDVLVYGATGAIGTAAVQLLKAMGAGVTAVCTSEYLELVRGLGADRVVDRTMQDFTRDERRYDAVFDAVGKSTFGRCRRLLKPGGRYLSPDAGPGWQNLPLAAIAPLFAGKRVIMPSFGGGREPIRHVRNLIESGQFRPVIDRRYALDQIVEAHRYVDTGQKVGSVVINVVGP